MCKNQSNNAIYGLGMIGTLIYNMQYAESFSQVLYGLLKSILWPAYLMYEIFSYFQI